MANKYKKAMKEKMLLKLDRDRLKTKNESLKITKNEMKQKLLNTQEVTEEKENKSTNRKEKQNP